MNILRQFSLCKAILRQKSLMSVPKSKQLIKDNRFAVKMEEKLSLISDCTGTSKSNIFKSICTKLLVFEIKTTDFRSTLQFANFKEYKTIFTHRRDIEKIDLMKEITTKMTDNARISSRFSCEVAMQICEKYN